MSTVPFELAEALAARVGLPAPRAARAVLGLVAETLSTLTFLGPLFGLAFLTLPLFFAVLTPLFLTALGFSTFLVIFFSLGLSLGFDFVSFGLFCTFFGASLVLSIALLLERVSFLL